MPSAEQLLDRLWTDYVEFNPHAQAVCDLLTAQGETVVNDHIALRTFDLPRVNVKSLSQSFVALGYQPAGEYEFTTKKLRAKHYQHKNAALPKVFISELKLAEFSQSLQHKAAKMVEAVTDQHAQQWDFAVLGRPWDISFADYEALAGESEYAGWVGAHGFRSNHFTIDVGALKKFESLADFNAFIMQAGFALNTSGGEIKGSPADFLEQSSTLAGEVEVSFSDGVHRIPACYYEFAKRYPLPDGTRFEGFVAKSADKIFESTDRPK